MSKKILPFLVLFIFFFSFNVVFADVVINEIQVLPTGEKFLELYNNGGSVVDLTDWEIKRKTESGTEYPLVPKSRLEGKSVQSGDYFLIANETSYTGSGTLDASWSSSNSGVASNNTVLVYDQGLNLIDKIGWGEASDCSSPCPANPTSGLSLQLVSGSWITATPTPGEENETIIPPPSPPETSDSGGIVHEENNSTTEAEGLKIKTQIIAPKIVFVSSPVALELESFGHNKELLHYGKYFLNFGDGDSKEIKISDNQKISHTYMYAGDYVVSLEYYTNVYGDMPDASDQMTIKVLPVEILVSRVGDEKDFFVELSNNANYDEDISGWVLVGKEKDFLLPRNTILGAKKKIIISSRITGFTMLDKDNLKLMTIQRNLVFDYGATLVQEIPPLLNKEGNEGRFLTNSPHLDPLLIKEREQGKITDSSVRQDLTQEKIPEENIDNNLEALAVNTDVLESEPINSYLSIFASIIFIGFFAGVVYFIRRKKIVQKIGDDFAILDD